MNKFKQISVLMLTVSMFMGSVSNTKAAESKYLHTEKEIISLYNSETKNLKESTKAELPEYPVINDSLSMRTLKTGDEVVYTVGGLSYENKKPNNYGTTGLIEMRLISYGFESLDTSSQLQSIEIPYTYVESKGRPNKENDDAVGIKVTISGSTPGANSSHDFQIIKNFYNDGPKDSIKVTREDIASAFPDSKFSPSRNYVTYFTPINAAGEDLDYVGAEKLIQEEDNIFTYTVNDEGERFNNYARQYFLSYFDWYDNNMNERKSSMSSKKYPYFETSDATIIPSKVDNLKPGDKVNLDIQVKNTSEYLPNERLTVGFDIIEGTDHKKRAVEFKINEGDKFIRIEPQQVEHINGKYTIPKDFKGNEIKLKPYIYGSFKEGTADPIYADRDDELDYNDAVTLKITHSGGNGGAVVDPDPKPPAPSKTVILASGEKYTDVLTATVLGNEKDAPILLSKKDSVDEKTLAEIKRLNAEDVIISGGEDSVSNKVVEQLNNYNVTRIAGQDRYETAVKIGNEVRKLTGNSTGAMLVDGTNFPDVITMSSLASGKRVPILITSPETLSKPTGDTIKSWGITDITIGGSYNSVSKDIENNLGVNKVSRLGGADRYKTAELIGTEVRKLTGNNADMILVDGTNFPDGITINSLASLFKAPIMLTEPDQLNRITGNKIKDWSIKNVLIGGGYNSVSKGIEDNLGVIKKERVAGQDRYETAVKISERLSQTDKAIGIN
ncbi:cell wall-binding repeat-containing protein [Metaclostridioides mangenotii]|uniref:cell wall-binding repeat-containing protein n=1 Tax=Metaclostridioides mangenotii TaxID=1540 RepID=UPI0026F20A3A|nr:cell wall-binding repeat-containing protein [Clostridioides mangenotii]